LPPSEIAIVFFFLRAVLLTDSERFLITPEMIQIFSLHKSNNNSHQVFNALDKL
jgi:hypothetical protein